jgi:hypothetical protein
MPDENASTRSMAVEAFGVVVEVTAEARHLAAIREVLPPGARPTTVRPENGRFTVQPLGGRGLIEVLYDEQSVTGGPVDLGVAVGILDAQMRMHIALNAPDYVFVHAGVVGIENLAVLLPGKSFAGKTTLVAALVRAGAEYWSDEYAVLTVDGLVHPYPKPLSVRNDAQVAEERSVESLGGCAGDRPLPVGLIALTRYKRGAVWAPRHCSRGEGAIKLLAHTVSARARPEQALQAVQAVATGAIVLDGDRGEADDTAAALIRALGSSAEPEPASSRS